MGGLQQDDSIGLLKKDYLIATHEVKPIIQSLHKGLSEENRQKGYQKALRYRGWERLVLTDFSDLWYIMYVVSNYRIEWVDIN